MNFLDPLWPAPAWVRAIFTTREGGTSRPPFDGLNLGDHVQDDPLAVAANRQALRGAMGIRPVFLQQVHGTAVATLDAEVPDGGLADACISASPGVACTIMVADCLPVLLAHRQARVVAAAHAGWRGLAGVGGQGVLESVLDSFWQQPSVKRSESAIEKRAEETLVWLGPCIGPLAFEVGAEVRETFCATDAQAASCFRPVGSGKFLADLPALARQRLRACGVTAIYGNDSSPSWCTASHPERFFSHRRDSVALGGSGRMAACIWLTD